MPAGANSRKGRGPIHGNRAQRIVLDAGETARTRIVEVVWIKVKLGSTKGSAWEMSILISGGKTANPFLC